MNTNDLSIYSHYLRKMPEIQAAMIGAAASAFLMVLSNMSNRRERDIREIFNRINQIEKAVAQAYLQPCHQEYLLSACKQT